LPTVSGRPTRPRKQSFLSASILALKARILFHSFRDLGGCRFPSQPPWAAFFWLIRDFNVRSSVGGQHQSSICQRESTTLTASLTIHSPHKGANAACAASKREAGGGPGSRGSSYSREKKPSASLHRSRRRDWPASLGRKVRRHPRQNRSDACRASAERNLLATGAMGF